MIFRPLTAENFREFFAVTIFFTTFTAEILCAELTERAELFRKITKTRKALHLTFVTTYGLQNNQYAGMIQKVVTLDELFHKKMG